MCLVYFPFGKSPGRFYPSIFSVWGKSDWKHFPLGHFPLGFITIHTYSGEIYRCNENVNGFMFKWTHIFHVKAWSRAKRKKCAEFFCVAVYASRTLSARIDLIDIIICKSSLIPAPTICCNCPRHLQIISFVYLRAQWDIYVSTDFAQPVKITVTIPPEFALTKLGLIPQ